MKTILLACLLCLNEVCGFSAAFTDSFDIDTADLASTGRNRYFVLEPG